MDVNVPPPAPTAASAQETNSARSVHRRPRPKPLSRRRTSETRGQAALWPLSQHDHRRHRNGPKRHGAKPDNDRDEHHCDHDEGAFGGDISAGQQQIHRSGGQPAASGEFADGMAQRQPRHARQPNPERGKDKPGQKPYVQARNGQQVRQVGSSERLKHILVNARPAACRDCGGKSADERSQCSLDAGDRGNSAPRCPSSVF